MTRLMTTDFPAMKFSHPDITAKGERRAAVDFQQLDTLWINTGTLCNIECANCYIHSSPTEDRLSYITAAEVTAYLDEIATERLSTREIGFTGGEPFMNPDIFGMVEDVLRRGHEALILTNAMQPMMRPRCREELRRLKATYGASLRLRVSLDHYTEELHELERGKGSFASTMEGLRFLAREGFALAVAGRMRSGEQEAEERAGFAALFAREKIAVDASNHGSLVLFPEMDEKAEVPEITTACWGILHVDPESLMCATSRMVVKRKGEAAPRVVACTLLPDDLQFDLGSTLAESFRPVKLNHRHCAKFCVLGGGSCSAA
ncbi:radical SAM protein [Parvibaculum sedimenti]|uniref:Radical SAM protein n=2 Tax=Parvibaculum sedimenti TaxID=2608632 RepID=A0A6N6VJL1_9HYPH|nr:radical SAM protein [Parvibaculum sedimenti]KAB7741287.1 radical SAM protein [Parvibaculum sedimenti]